MASESFDGGALLARIVARTRPPDEPMTSEQWGRWAARRYATTIELPTAPPEIRNAPPVWSEPRGEYVRPLLVGWQRRAASSRKRCALALFVLADERVDLAPAWSTLAARWAATHDRLPGGDAPIDQQFADEVESLRGYERAAARLRE